MTSETYAKHPIVVPLCKKADGSWFGVYVVIATWIFLYFNVLTQLYDGIMGFLGYDVVAYAVVKVAVDLTNSKLSGAGAEGTVEFGSGKYFALCGLGGVLSCGITHTAIVPLDLVKCRIQVGSCNNHVLLFGIFRLTLKNTKVL